MSNPFAATANTDGAKIELESDRIGGSFIWDTDAYLVTINAAYAGKSTSGAASMSYEVTGADGRKFKWTEWVTSGDAKGNKPYFEKDGQKSYLPGYNRSNAIALLTTEKELHALKFEEKVVKIRNNTTKTDVATPVQMAVDMLGKQVILGIAKQEVNKQKETGALDANGKKVYADTAETRFVNEVDKIFYAKDNRTIAELRSKTPEAEFYAKWIEANKGKVIDKVKKVAAGAQAGVPGGANDSDVPTDSLFN